MSENNTVTSRFEIVVIPGQFSLLICDTWKNPSVLLHLYKDERKMLRDAFDIHWSSIDAHLWMFQRCWDQGRLRDVSNRHAKRVKILFEMDRVENGIRIALDVVSMVDREGNPYLADQDDGGNPYPRSRTIERVFPAKKIEALFGKAQALTYGMNASLLMQWSLESGDRKAAEEMHRSQEHFDEVVNGPKNPALTVTVEEAVRNGNGKKQGGGKKSDGKKREKLGSKKLGDASKEATPDDRSDEIARQLTVGLGLEDPGAGLLTDGEGLVIEPEASASPTPTEAPKAKKEKKERAPKLGLADLASLKDQLPAGPTDGSNGQS